ncbi:hypothetical protein [Salipiger mucosus]|nr:hypothetical protein [Salipiger mucosus]
MTQNAAPELSLRAYATPEDLPESLRKYCQSPEETGTKTWWFKHPFYVSWFPVATPCDIGELIDFRQQHYEAELKARNWGGVFAGVERAFRLPFLMDLVSNGEFMDAEEDPREAARFWKVARELWSDGEEDEDNPIWTRVMTCGVPHRGFMTRSRDRRALREMPENVKLYRGVQFEQYERPDPKRGANAGWAWSFSEETATWFARRFAEPGDTRFLVTADVPKSRIAAYITGRGEEEVLIEPGSVDPASMKVKAV